MISRRLSNNVRGYTRREYTTAGTYSITFPYGVRFVRVTLAGGGGGASGYLRGSNSWGTASANPMSGGDGELITQTVQVIAGVAYTLVVGKAGAQGQDVTSYPANDSGDGDGYVLTAGTGERGGQSSFGGNLAIAYGGYGGIGKTGYSYSYTSGNASPVCRLNITNEGAVGANYGNAEGGDGERITWVIGQHQLPVLQHTPSQTGWAIIEYGSSI